MLNGGFLEARRPAERGRAMRHDWTDGGHDCATREASAHCANSSRRHAARWSLMSSTRRAAIIIATVTLRLVGDGVAWMPAPHAYCWRMAVDGQRCRHGWAGCCVRAADHAMHRGAPLPSPSSPFPYQQPTARRCSPKAGCRRAPVRCAEMAMA